ncbi:MAG TPA: DUF2277 domain-containing protein [Anaerolineales bacterium]
MCRSIKTLRRPEQPPTEEELHAAALQYVRKVSGYRMPSRRNQVVFEQAVEEIAMVTQKLLDSLVTTNSRLSGSKSMKGE